MQKKATETIYKKQPRPIPFLFQLSTNNTNIFKKLKQHKKNNTQSTLESSKFSGSKSKSKRDKDQTLILISIDQTLESGR